jgi:hypothetical protein
MTGWHIRPGYSGEYDRALVQAALDADVARTRDEQLDLTAERLLETGADQVERDVAEALWHYRDCTDLTIQRIETSTGPEWMMLASGGAAHDAKKIARRVFLRVLMRRMHARGMDISVVVA